MDSKSASEPLAKWPWKVQASSIFTSSTLPVRVCWRCLMKVSVIALTSVIEPLSQMRGIDAVREQVAGDAAAGGLGIEAPEAGAALREIGADRPVLEEIRAVMEDLAELAGVDDLLGERHRRDAAVIVPDGIRHAGLLDLADHLLALRAVEGERLFAEDHLAGARGGDGDLGVRIIRA